MVGDKGRQPARQAMRTHDAPCRNGQLTTLEGEIPDAQFLDLSDVLEHTHRELPERPADIGELHVASHALQQGQTERGLETPHHTTDRALRETERLSGCGHVLAFGDGEKRVQLIERDAGPRMPGTRLRRAHRGVSREAPVLGGGRWRRWLRGPPQPTRRRSGCRCRRPRRARLAPRTDPTHP